MYSSYISLWEAQQKYALVGNPVDRNNVLLDEVRRQHTCMLGTTWWEQIHKPNKNARSRRHRYDIYQDTAWWKYRALLEPLPQIVHLPNMKTSRESSEDTIATRKSTGTASRHFLDISIVYSNHNWNYHYNSKKNDKYFPNVGHKRDSPNSIDPESITKIFLNGVKTMFYFYYTLTINAPKGFT